MKIKAEHTAITNERFIMELILIAIIAVLLINRIMSNYEEVSTGRTCNVLDVPAIISDKANEQIATMELGLSYYRMEAYAKELEEDKIDIKHIETLRNSLKL